jgi:hypothetical protein
VVDAGALTVTLPRRIAVVNRVGSVHAISPAAELRPRVAEAVERGMARANGENLKREPS